MLNLLLLLHFWHQVSSYDVSTYPWLKFGGELGLELADCSWAVVSLNEHLWGDDRMLEILQAVGLETKVTQLGSHLRVLNCVPCFHFRMEHVFKCSEYSSRNNAWHLHGNKIRTTNLTNSGGAGTIWYESSTFTFVTALSPFLNTSVSDVF